MASRRNIIKGAIAGIVGLFGVSKARSKKAPQKKTKGKAIPRLGVQYIKKEESPVQIPGVIVSMIEHKGKLIIALPNSIWELETNGNCRKIVETNKTKEAVRIL